jgi:hypothetical protein
VLACAIISKTWLFSEREPLFSSAVWEKACKADALKGMEKAGLISVEWRKGKPPLVTFTRKFPSTPTVS